VKSTSVIVVKQSV